MRLFNQIKKFGKIPGIERKLFVQGLLISGFFYVIVKLVPLRFYYGIMKSNPNSIIIEKDRDFRKRLVIRSIKRVTRFSAWNCNCLNQVLTLKVLCNQIGLKSEVRFKLYNNNESAHAYLVIDNDINYLALFKVPGIILRTTTNLIYQ